MNIEIAKTAIALARQNNHEYNTFINTHFSGQPHVYEITNDAHNDTVEYKETLAAQTNLIDYLYSLSQEDAVDLVALMFLGKDSMAKTSSNGLSGKERFLQEKKVFEETLEGNTNAQAAYQLLIEKTKKLDSYLQAGLAMLEKE